MTLEGERRIVGISIGLIAATMAGLVTAQPAQKKPEPPVFGVGVTLVAVPVFVTDKSGRSVQGLTADDFEVEDQGKPVPIAAFQAIDVDASSATVGAGAEAPSALSTLPIAVQAAAPRQFVILIDSQFSPRAGLLFGRRAITDYVRESLAPGDLLAVATTGPAGLRILANFTTDHEYVARVVAGTATAGTPSSDPLGFSSAGSSGGVGSLIGAPLGPGGIAAAAGGGGGRNADAELAAQDALMQQASQAEYRSSAFSFLTDLEKLVNALSPLRGRKQILLFSGGFAEAAWASTDKAEGQALFAKMKAIYLAASRSDVVIHSIDLAGIEPAVDMISQTGPNGSLDSSGPRSAGSALAQDKGRGTLIAIAENTGGRAVRPTGDFRNAFGEVDRISRHSYIVAFETDESDARDERSRKLKVRVKRPGLSVSHRTEYSAGAPRSGSRPSVQMLASEAISKGITGGPLRLRLSTLPYRDPAGKPSLQAVLQIDGAALGEAARGRELAVQIYGYAMAGGRVLDGLALNTSIDLTKFGPAVRDSGVSVLTAFPVSTGNVDLRFFVRAGSADLTGSIQRGVAVPAFGAGERVVSAPLFMLPPAGRLVVPFQPKGRPAITIPFYVGDSRFVPDTAAVLTPGRARDACVFVWRDRASGAQAFNVTAELIQGGQEPRTVRIDGSPRIVADPDGFDRYVVTLLPPAAAPGPYRLRLTFIEPGTGRSVRTETEVDLEG
ncbi:MAG: VWA domain-containing protein [Vicinamibacteria bacterium]|nr:VWA domain-containing protein [Vicinamibacteria bacterium]